MPLLKRKKVLAAKIETTVGTAESLTAADAAFNVYNPMIQANISMEEREGQGGFGYLPAVPGGYGGTVTFRTMLEWDGSSTEPAWADTFFPACGWVKTIGTYNPTSQEPGANVKTLTIAVYEDGVRKTLAGCMGTFVVTLPTGRPGYIDWTFTGVWQAPSDVALISPTYPTVTPLRYAGDWLSGTTSICALSRLLSMLATKSSSANAQLLLLVISRHSSLIAAQRLPSTLKR